MCQASSRFPHNRQTERLTLRRILYTHPSQTSLCSDKTPPQLNQLLEASPLPPDGASALTSVGAIRLRLGWPPDGSSASPSADSLLVPAGAVNDARGVSGGVVIGMPTTLLELVAAMLGTCPDIRGGLLTTPVCDEFELDRAGDPARGLTKDAVVVGGDGAVSELPESRCLW